MGGPGRAERINTGGEKSRKKVKKKHWKGCCPVVCDGTTRHGGGDAVQTSIREMGPKTKILRNMGEIFRKGAPETEVKGCQEGDFLSGMARRKRHLPITKGTSFHLFSEKSNRGPTKGTSAPLSNSPLLNAGSKKDQLNRPKGAAI